MELKEIEPRNLTDKIVESMSEAEIEADTEAETDAYVEPKYTHTPETEVEINTSVVLIPKAEAELLLGPEPINRPIAARDSESVYENPYSTNVYHNYGGTRISFQTFGNDQSRSKKWSLSCLIIGLGIGLLIGATVSGLSIFMHFTKKSVCTTLQTTPTVTATPSTSTELYGELNSQLCTPVDNVSLCS